MNVQLRQFCFKPTVTFGLSGLLGLGMLLVGSSIYEAQAAGHVETQSHEETTDSGSPSGMVIHMSPYSVAETGDRLESVLTERGVTVFARVDHAAGADSVELSLRPTQVIIFGNPQVGTPLMQCAQSVAIDLPQKALIWEDTEGHVYLGYNDPAYLAERHSIEGCDEAIAQVSTILSNLTETVVSAE